MVGDVQGQVEPSVHGPPLGLCEQPHAESLATEGRRDEEPADGHERPAHPCARGRHVVHGDMTGQHSVIAFGNPCAQELGRTQPSCGVDGPVQRIVIDPVDSGERLHAAVQVGRSAITDAKLNGSVRQWESALGRSRLGSFRTTASYEPSIASASSSSGMAPPERSVFHPERPMYAITEASSG